MKIAIIDHREEGYELEKQALSSENVELRFCRCKNEEELIETVKDAEIIIFTVSVLNRRVISHLSNCRMIIRYGVGMDNVDLDAATEKGIYVCNAPHYGTFTVAEHAFALLLSLSRKILLLDKNLRKNIWGLSSVVPVHSLRNKTLGLVGFGNIGKYVCKMALAFEMKIIVHDPYLSEKTIEESGATKVSFTDLIRRSDHISIHAPLTDETRHLFNKNVFAEMKKTAAIINTSRGGLINQADLIEALKSGRIAGAGLDVFENEPLDPENEILPLGNVILTPHAAWYTEDSIKSLHQEVIENVIRVIHGKKPYNIVNSLQ